MSGYFLKEVKKLFFQVEFSVRNIKFDIPIGAFYSFTHHFRMIAIE